MNEQNMNTTNANSHGDEQEKFEVFQVVWLSGIAVSTSCLLLQFAFFALIPASRKSDEKILTQITFTRITNTICEYTVVYIMTDYYKFCCDFVVLLYFTSDFALVLWMLIFTKNLYDKIVVVFSTRKLNLIITSICVWAISLPFGVLGVFILNRYRQYFNFYCRVIFATIKGLVVILNLLIYLRIFYVAIKRSKESTRNLGEVIKSALVAFLLINTTCLQIIITDLVSYLHGNRNIYLVKTFAVVNSYHSVFITAIFVIIMKAKLNYSIRNSMMLGFSNRVT